MPIEDNRPTVIFTTFWDAQKILEKGVVVHKEVFEETNITTYIELDNSEVCSIALSYPKDVKFDEMFKLKFFCPTWDLLKKYKEDADWDYYVKKFMDLLSDRKTQVKNWVVDLDPTKVYILCCWENTSNGAHCHRQLIYEAFKKSEWAKGKMNLVYRHGGIKQLR